MNQTLEQKAKVHYHCLVEPKDIGAQHETEVATIGEAYFGRHPTPGPFRLVSPLGLNLWIKYQSYGIAGATYTDMKSIEGLMDDFKVGRVEDLKGKEVVAHTKGMRLLGISVPETQ